MEKYIQNKLDEFDRISGLYSFQEDSLNEECCENGDKLNIEKTRNFIEQSLTDYHNHIVEKIEKLNKDAEKFVPFQKIHYQAALMDLKSLLQDTNLKE